MTKHTPLPWREGPTEGIGQRGRLRVVDVHGVQVADCEAPKATPTTFVRPLPEDAANVAFILRACNSHDDLLRIAHAAYHALRSYEHGNTAQELAASVAAALDLTIAKAEGR